MQNTNTSKITITFFEKIHIKKQNNVINNLISLFFFSYFYFFCYKKTLI